MKVLVLNGPNLNMLGIREPEVYGSETLEQINDFVRAYADQHQIEVVFSQSNHEGVLIDTLQAACGQFDAVVFNPGAYTHYSYALHDAVASIPLPVVEVHLSDISAREPWRAVSVIAPACAAQIAGHGRESYTLALDFIMKYCAKCETKQQ